MHCLRMKTTDKTLNLRLSDTLAAKETGTAIWGQAVQWVKIAFHVSFASKEKKEATYRTTKEESQGQQKLVMVEWLEAKLRVANKFTGDRQPKFARNMDQSRQEGDEMERCYKNFP